MTRKTLLLLSAGLLFLAACKKEPDLPDDPHVTLVNPFIGVWNVKDEYWQFRRDSTGGKADTAAGPFGDDFSFLVYAGQDVQTTPNDGKLVMFDDATASLYFFFIEGDEAYLTPESELELTVELSRISGVPQALNLSNSLLGEWTADWTSIHGPTWSIKYRDDGTVKTYHHEIAHQFENAYALRGETLVIFGEWRFGIAPVKAQISPLGNGTFQVTETQLNPATTVWIYAKVTVAEWL